VPGGFQYKPISSKIECSKNSDVVVWVSDADVDQPGDDVSVRRDVTGYDDDDDDDDVEIRRRSWPVRDVTTHRLDTATDRRCPDDHGDHEAALFAPSRAARRDHAGRYVIGTFFLLDRQHRNLVSDLSDRERLIDVLIQSFRTLETKFKIVKNRCAVQWIKIVKKSRFFFKVQSRFGLKEQHLNGQSTDRFSPALEPKHLGMRPQIFYLGHTHWKIHIKV